MPEIDTGADGAESLAQVEHSSPAKAKRVALRYFNSATGEWENVSDVTPIPTSGLTDDELRASPVEVEGTETPGSALTANKAVKVVGWDSSGNARMFRTQADNSDGNATDAAPNHIAAMAHGVVFNGTTWDRMRGDTQGTIVKDVVYTTRIDEASATVTYIGVALPGTATSASTWQIKKIDSSSGTSITFADGNSSFDNEWDERASLSYS